MKHEISDQGDPQKYWTQIPNIVYTLGLTTFEFTLYSHLKWAAGAKPNGKCTKSTATLAKETGMGAGTVSRAKTELEKKRLELGGKSLIKTKEVSNPRGGKPYQEITITDIWKVNILHFASSTVEVDEADQVPVEVEPSSRPTSTVEINKNYKQELNTNKNIQQRGTRLPDDFTLSESMREWGKTYAAHVNLDNALLEFIDYWRGVPGSRGTKLDWAATWRNRMRELEARGTHRNGNGFRTTSKAEQSVLNGERLIARYEQQQRRIRSEGEDDHRNGGGLPERADF
jgi:hypothetical protein